MVTDTPVGQKVEEAGNEEGDDPKLTAMVRGTTLSQGALANRRGGYRSSHEPLQRARARGREVVLGGSSFRPDARDGSSVSNTGVSVINRGPADRPRFES